MPYANKKDADHRDTVIRQASKPQVIKRPLHYVLMNWPSICQQNRNILAFAGVHADYLLVCQNAQNFPMYANEHSG